MSNLEREQILNLAYDAGHLTALCQIVGTAVSADPHTSIIADVIEGLHTLARHLRDDLLKIGDPE